MAIVGSEATDEITKCVINVVLGIEPNLTSVPVPCSELHIQSSFIHPLVQGMTKNASNVVPHCSSKLGLNSSDLALSSGRPDYRVDTLLPPLYTSKYTSLFGEVKPTSSKNNEVELLIDFYKTCIYMKLTLKYSNANAILGFITVGTTVTFYLQYRPEKNLNLMIELGKIEVPTTTTSFSMLIGQLDSIYKICQIYHQHCTVPGSSSINSISSEIPRSPTLLFSVLKALLSEKEGDNYVPIKQTQPESQQKIMGQHCEGSTSESPSNVNGRIRNSQIAHCGHQIAA
ncbi:hypothetical protein EDC96DRAFT_547362 [Choanephora cucurbitarum]|nr:hypothetical protein EDC96DRAFT_547362 [Choanephora cucurbitarum]